MFYSYGWGLEEHEQIIERIGPMRQRQAGLDRSVLLYYLTAEDTIEEDIKARLADKPTPHRTTAEPSSRSDR